VQDRTKNVTLQVCFLQDFSASQAAREPEELQRKNDLNLSYIFIIKRQ
jgi:hypothetical protein